MKVFQPGLSQLSKTLISIRGPDATKFLNGLLTTRLLPNIVKKKQHTISANEAKHSQLESVIDPVTNYGLIHEDIYDPDDNIYVTREGVNSMILNSKGRVVTDLFLYCDPFHNFQGQFDAEMKEPRYLMEVDTGQVSKLMMMLKLHKLSARVDIKPQSSLSSYYYYNDSVEFDVWLEDEVQARYFRSADPVNALQSANSFIANQVVFSGDFASRVLGFAVDNRIPNFGFKFVTSGAIKTSKDGRIEEDVFSSEFLDRFGVGSVVPESNVINRRFANGVFEAGDAPSGESLLPFECNLDYTNGLSLDKGCYVGQELTIRTFNNGIIRKRIYPVQFFNLDQGTVDAIRQAQVDNDDDAEIAFRETTALDQVASASLTRLEMTPLVEDESKEGNEQEEAKATATVTATSPFASSSKPVRKRKSSSGKVLAVRGDTGLCLLNMAEVDKSPFFKIDIPSFEGKTTVGARAIVPDWWPE
ncbi:CAF17 [Candida theae]|uniref:CAF17 n=1 Tax=Candida theae TaxID=1198502 RepID=A0AAD5BFL8_9ASCO|nr:CAF17 [Candida theae]KAI5958328.1 CAF17 [Candida theae]